MALQLQFLESLVQTRYLSAENYLSYRAIMRILYQEYQQMHYTLDQNRILALLRANPYFQDYDPNRLTLDLAQLVEWGNLTAVQDPSTTRTIADFKARRYQYILTPESLEIERMTITLENLSTRTAGLSTNAFRRIQIALDTASRLDEMSSGEVAEWWHDLEEDFTRLNQNYQDYLREFYDPNSQRQMASDQFVAHKQRLVRYLEDFIQDLQHNSEQIGSQLEKITGEQAEHILNRVFEAELDIPRVQGEMKPGWEEKVRERERGLWSALTDWFCGSYSNARQVMEVTNEVIRQVVQNAALLVQMRSMGMSNRAELNHIMGLFGKMDNIRDAHRLCAMVFGAQSVRHFLVNAERETDQVDSSTYEEAPMEFQLRPSTRNYSRMRVDRTGFQDKSREKAEAMRKMREQAREMENQVARFIVDGKLDFGNLPEPPTPEVRDVFLEWLSEANLSPDRTGHTQFGQSFRLKRKSRGRCVMTCTDGKMSMPDCMLVFEEG